jgi:hypothetical protein
MSEHAPASVIIEAGAAPRFHKNVFQGLTPDAFRALGDHSLQAIRDDNWFVGSSAALSTGRRGPRSPLPAASGPRPGR